ncbi:MAG: malate dehydrogenase [Simkaniaceae bacterium]
MKPLKRIAVSGCAGQIAYSFLFRIATGEVFGKDQPIALHLLEVPHALEALKGVVMELEDCSYPLLQEIKTGSDPYSVYEGVNLAVLLGAKPRGPGMERKDLLADNGKIFVDQGKALNKSAAKDLLVLVVGNPCNTNCLVTMHHAPDIPKERFHAMTRLDQNRAEAQLAKKASCTVGDINHMIIWGNHSATQVPDFENAKIQGKPAEEIIKDRNWLEHDFIQTIQQRGAEIIKARGKSSAASAANAAIDTIKSLYQKSPEGYWFSSAVCSDTNPYGVEKDLIFSFPCISQGDGKWQIVKDVPWSPFIEEKIKTTQQELLDERDAVRHLLK